MDRPTSFLATFALALVACGGILAQRLSGGSLVAALAAQFLLTLAAVAIARLESLSLGAQILGGLTCILAVHLGLLLFSHPALVEAPAQLVNDVVAVFAPIAIVRAARTQPPSTAVVVGTLAAVALYRFTGSMWHLDPKTLEVSVQDLVTGEFAGSALGVTMFRLMT